MEFSRAGSRFLSASPKRHWHAQLLSARFESLMEHSTAPGGEANVAAPDLPNLSTLINTRADAALRSTVTRLPLPTTNPFPVKTFPPQQNR